MSAMEPDELAQAVLEGPLPSRVKKVLDIAEQEGWHLNAKGATFCMRFDKDDDELAVPFYVTWQLGRTEKGNLSWRFMSAGTATLQPMSPDDVIEYMKDPTVIYGKVLENEAGA